MRARLHKANSSLIIIISFILVISICLSYADTPGQDGHGPDESAWSWSYATKFILPWVATIGAIGALLYSWRSVVAALRYNKQCAYQECMGQLTELKARFVDNADLVERSFETSEVFDLVRGHLSGKHFLMLSNFYYKAEQMWSLRRKGLLNDDEWYTISSLLRNYLTIQDIRFVFYNYILNPNIRTHQLAFIEDLKLILNESEKEFTIENLMGNKFDPYEMKLYQQLMSFVKIA